MTVDFAPGMRAVEASAPRGRPLSSGMETALQVGWSIPLPLPLIVMPQRSRTSRDSASTLCQTIGDGCTGRRTMLRPSSCSIHRITSTRCPGFS